MSKYLKNSPNKPFVPTPYGALATPLVNIHYSVDQIQKRVSYSFWKQITETINNQHLSSEEKVRAMHIILNDRMMFNTEQQSRWDKESMDLALEDFSQKKV